MRALLAVAAHDHERGIVLVGKEFEARGIFERVDVVFLAETRCQGPFEGVKVFKYQLAEVGALSAFEEEGCARVFGLLRRFVVEVAFCAVVFRLHLPEGGRERHGGGDVWENCYGKELKEVMVRSP